MQHWNTSSIDYLKSISLKFCTYHQQRQYNSKARRFEKIKNWAKSIEKRTHNKLGVSKQRNPMCHKSFQYWTTQMLSLISSSADILGFTFDMNIKILVLVSQHSYPKAPREGHWEKRQCGHLRFCQMVSLPLRLSSACFICLTLSCLVPHKNVFLQRQFSPRSLWILAF